MTCPHCGADTPVDAARCTVCGAPQTPATSAITPNLSEGAATAGAAVFDATGLGTVAAATGTHQLDSEVTRPHVVGEIHSPADPHRITTGHSRQFKMLTPGEALGGRYHIVRLLGVGGMGAVYHAWDAELGVAVALKVIRGDITGDRDQAAHVERQFKCELLLARFAEGLPELEACQKRCGEATALFFDDKPTVRYLAPVSYWAARAEEGLKMASARSRYQAFIDLRKDAVADPLVQDARRRLQ